MIAFELLLIVVALILTGAFVIWARYYLEYKIWQSRDTLPFVQHIIKEEPPKIIEKHEEEKEDKKIQKVEDEPYIPIEVEEEAHPEKHDTRPEREAARKKLRNSIIRAEILKRKGL